MYKLLAVCFLFGKVNLFQKSSKNKIEWNIWKVLRIFVQIFIWNSTSV